VEARRAWAQRSDLGEESGIGMLDDVAVRPIADISSTAT